MLKDALLEIRIENIPARFVISAEEQLKKYAAQLLAAANLPCAGIEAYGTYKRLVLYISGVPARTGEKVQKAYGPAARLLKGADGNYTPQAAGFARSRGTTPDKLGVETLPNKGEVLVFESRLPGRPAVKALAEIFPGIVSRLQFPKNMVWEATRFRFARPIRGLLALHGDKPVAFALAGIRAGRITVGLSAKGSRQIKIPSAEKYFKALEHANVVVKDADRRETLRRELERLSKRMKLKVEADPELLEENLYLAEYPVCVVAGYSQEFLALPPELVHLVMKKQFFFTVAGQEGVLQPYFVGIRDGVSRGQRNVEEGFRNVLEARFRDAVFFYTRDLAEPLSGFSLKLAEITFQEKLGTMRDKTGRVEKLTAWLCGASGAAVDREDMLLAARHVYTDLASGLVREFTELQGVMGYYYAKNAGLSEAVSKIVGEFYRPVSAGSPLPSSAGSALVSLAGKLDTLACAFSLGLIPSGSEDPHGLRRQALGAVRIALENNLRLDFRAAVSEAFAALPPEAPPGAPGPLLDFLWQRAEAVLAGEGCRFDEIKTVREFFMAGADLPDCRERVRDIHSLRADPDFAGIATAFKRARNILRQARSPLNGLPDEGSFEKDEERVLYGEIQAMSGRLKAHLAGRDYAKGLSELLSIKGSLDNFFDKVMVMAEDPKVRDNRLNLIKSLVMLVEGVADLSQLQ